MPPHMWILGGCVWQYFSFLGAFFLWKDFLWWHFSCTVDSSMKITSWNCSSSLNNYSILAFKIKDHHLTHCTSIITCTGSAHVCLLYCIVTVILFCSVLLCECGWCEKLCSLLEPCTLLMMVLCLLTGMCYSLPRVMFWGMENYQTVPCDDRGMLLTGVAALLR